MFLRSRILFVSSLLISVLMFSSSAQATPITYIFQGESASGDIGGITFTNSDITITALADTDNIGAWCCSDVQNTNLSASIFIDGIGSADILTESHVWHGGSNVGIGANLGANWMTFFDTTFNSFDLSSEIGPVNGLANDVIQFVNVNTSLGILNFSDADLSGSFQAVVGVSEPSAIALLALGLVCFSFRKRSTMAL